MAGYSGNPLVTKLGIKEGTEVHAVGAPKEYPELVSPLPEGAKINARLSSNADLVHLFATQRTQLSKRLKAYRGKLKPTAVFKGVLSLAVAVLVIPFALPERAIIPVQGASSGDWNKRSFWYEPWGASGVHKGVDIFAPAGRPVVAPVYGAVVYRGRLGIGGNVVAVLGPKWRIHYFAHLRDSDVYALEFVAKGDVVGTVGTSVNAAGKAPHLHYAVLQLIPRVWKATRETQGWKRMFFVNPGEIISGP